MKYLVLPALFAMIVSSCKLSPDADKRYNENENTVYKLRLNPPDGSKYHYDIASESKLNLEAEEKKLENINRTTTGMYYFILKDSTGNLVLDMSYDTIHLYSKSGDNESEMDAANAAFSINPVEKMLGVLKSAQIKATLNSKGEVTAIQGYKELGARLIDGFAEDDVYGRQMAQSQWDQLIGKGLVKKNLDQLFTIFPDSAVRIGDKWKINSKQEEAFGLNVKTLYRLKDIEDGVTIIEAEGEMVSDSAAVNLMGYTATANLKGDMHGEYRMETKTGMLLSSTITSQLKGSIQMAGKEVPVEIENTLKVTGRKVK